MDNAKDMRRDFSSRDELAAYLREQFPQANAISPQISDTFVGGRAAAERRLSEIDPGKNYQQTRNHLQGGVSRLSPYIRYGVLSLAEVRDSALERVEYKTYAEKFINELGWRDYWQRLYAALGDDIWTDLEPYKTGFTADDYADHLPEDLLAGETGTSMDPFIAELYAAGYIHNHARMWLAAYVVHWRRVKWQVGALWFLSHLLDGDPASNNLSWQWVASTFSHKPYFFNLSNLKKNGAAVEGYDNSVFEGTYVQLEKRLFPHKPPSPPRPRSRGKKG